MPHFLSKPQSGRGKSLMMPRTAVAQRSQGIRPRYTQALPALVDPESQREPLARETGPQDVPPEPHKPALRQWSGLSQPIPSCSGSPHSWVPWALRRTRAPGPILKGPEGRGSVPGPCGNNSRRSNSNCHRCQLHHAQARQNPPATPTIQTCKPQGLRPWPSAFPMQAPGYAVLDMRM